MKLDFIFLFLFPFFFFFLFKCEVFSFNLIGRDPSLFGCVAFNSIEEASSNCVRAILRNYLFAMERQTRVRKGAVKKVG